MWTLLYLHPNNKVAIDNKLKNVFMLLQNLSEIRGVIAPIYPEGAIYTISSVCLPD